MAIIVPSYGRVVILCKLFDWERQIQMSINVQWDNLDRTVVMIDFHRPWTWKEFDSAIEQMLNLFNSVNHRVDVLFDIRDGGFPPPDAIKHFRKAAEIQHPNGGLLVYIAPRVLVQFINSILKIMTVAFAGSGTFESPKFIFTKSLEEAHAYLSNHHTVKAS